VWLRLPGDPGRPAQQAGGFSVMAERHGGGCRAVGTMPSGRRRLRQRHQAGRSPDAAEEPGGRRSQPAAREGSASDTRQALVTDGARQRQQRASTWTPSDEFHEGPRRARLRAGLARAQRGMPLRKVVRAPAPKAAAPRRAGVGITTEATTGARRPRDQIHPQAPGPAAPRTRCQPASPGQRGGQAVDGGRRHVPGRPLGSRPLR
jgi:hypothetical protein